MISFIQAYEVREAQQEDLAAVITTDSIITFEHFIPTMNQIHADMFPDAGPTEILYWNIGSLQKDVHYISKAMQDTNKSVIGAFENGQCLGFIWGTYHLHKKTIYIDLLMVRSSARRRGIAKAILNALHDSYPQAEYSIVNPFAHRINSGTLHFYESQGYTFSPKIPADFSDIFPHELHFKVSPQQTRHFQTNGYYTFGVKKFSPQNRGITMLESNIEKITYDNSEHPIRNEIRTIVSDITPLDALEKQHQEEVLSWIDSGELLFRIAKPAVPNKHLVSYFVMYDETAQKVLLVDHKKALLWLPSGGHVELNEHPKETAARECKEELMTQAEFYMDTPLFITSTVTVGLTAGHTDISLWYVIKGDSTKEYQYDAGEFNEIRWFSFDEIPYDRADMHMKRFIEKLKTCSS